MRKVCYYAILVLMMGWSGEAYPERLLNCSKQRHIFLLDRTSQMNEEEDRAFRNGIGYLFTGNQVSGFIELIDIRDSGLSYSPLNQTCIPDQYRPTSVCKEYFDSREETEAESSRTQTLTDRFFDIISYFWSPGEQFDDFQTLNCEQEISVFQNKSRELRDEASRIIFEILDQGVDSSKTSIVEAIVEISYSRCSDANCNIYVFSNLLDNNWKEIISNDHDLKELGSKVVERYEQFDSGIPKFDTALVWGFGFNELDGEGKSELPSSIKRKLSAYWSGVFSVLADKPVPISFEMRR